MYRCDSHCALLKNIFIQLPHPHPPQKQQPIPPKWMKWKSIAIFQNKTKWMSINPTLHVPMPLRPVLSEYLHSSVSAMNDHTHCYQSKLCSMFLNQIIWSQKVLCIVMSANWLFCLFCCFFLLFVFCTIASGENVLVYMWFYSHCLTMPKKN